MTEQDLTIQRLKAENARLHRKLAEAILDINEILIQREMCGYCMYCDADCRPGDGSCVPKWRGM